LASWTPKQYSQEHKISSEVEVEENSRIPFLDVLLERKSDGSLLHSVYRKPTHTNQYIHTSSHHHSSQKNPDKLEEEKTELEKIFMKNGYATSVIRKSQKQRRTVNNEDRGNDNLYATLPYVKDITDKIGRILTKKNMKISFTPYIKLPNMLRPVKDIIPLQLSGVYRIPCICGKLYIGQTGRTVLTRLN